MDKISAFRAFTVSVLFCASALAVSCGGNGGSDAARIERYIRADAASRLVIEVDAVPDYQPYASTGGRLVEGLAEVLDKPDGIEVVMDGDIEPRGDDHTWSRDELFALADRTDDLEVPAGTAKMHVIFVDGEGESDSGNGVLGLAWDHRQIVIFKQTLEQSCDSGTLPIRQQRLCENAELSVLTHEVGHTIGLVDNGLPMVSDHADPEHPHHDVDDSCVMYWAYEGERLFDRLTSRLMGGNDKPLGFDAACKEDIADLRDAS